MLIVCSIQTVIWAAAISLNLSLPSCYTPVSCFLLNEKQEQAELVFVTVRWTDSQFCTVASAGTKLLPDLFHPPLPLCSLSSHRSSPPLSIAWCELSPPFKSNLCARFFCVVFLFRRVLWRLSSTRRTCGDVAACGGRCDAFSGWIMSENNNTLITKLLK